MDSDVLRKIADGVYVREAPQGFLGLNLGTRMTALESEQGLLVHSPVALEPEQIASIENLRWALAPNLFHHLYIGHWIDAGVEAWAAKGLEKKRSDLSFKGTITADSNPFGDDFRLLPLSCFSTSNEVVLLHRPSRTLVVTDLVFNLSEQWPWFTRTSMRLIGGYPGCKTTLLERLGMKRDIARKEIGAIAQWDFDRLIMAHGNIIETGGKEAFLKAFSWLLGSS